MQTAIGRLRYDPRLLGLPSKDQGRWLILECDPDWSRMYRKEAERRIPGRWMLVADADRVFNEAYQGRPQRPLLRRFVKGGGSFTEQQITDPSELPSVYVDFTPHLGLVKPRFEEPAWGPHISIIRGESLTASHACWEFQARLGGAGQRLAGLRSTLQQVTQKVEAYAATVPAIHSPKERRRVEAEVQDMKNTARTLRHQVEGVEREVARLQERQSFPDWLREGADVAFEYDPDLRLGNTHWYLRVRCPLVPDLRRTYGLSDYPKIPLHLTVGVTEG